MSEVFYLLRMYIANVKYFKSRSGFISPSSLAGHPPPPLYLLDVWGGLGPHGRMKRCGKNTAGVSVRTPIPSGRPTANQPVLKFMHMRLP